ncbi:MAG: lysophospholipid acyltransferase family protein [Vallitaleaceae bacterium]|jgi:1-acyl-sn-glycerol-3-phosphate acyltransferase|nr:lysophospholipid acyltransferase family protein [Vallitaleaceae bacterium]
MIRISLCFIFVLIVFLITLPFSLISFLVGRFNKRFQYRFGYLILSPLSKVFYKINGAKLTVTGQEFIPKDETVLFVGNHRSFIDIPLLLGFTNRPVAFVAKESLKKTPMINFWMFQIGCLFLDRTNLRKGVATIKEGIQMLKDGHTLVVFPEGTRSLTAELLPFKPGSLKLATKSRVRVVPFAIKGTDDVFENNGTKFRPAPVSLSFGEPIDLHTLESDATIDSTDYVKKTIEDLRSRMK